MKILELITQIKAHYQNQQQQYHFPFFFEDRNKVNMNNFVITCMK